MEFNFTVNGPPVVSSRLPSEDSIDVSTNSQITLTFDRAIIPLSNVQHKKYPKEWPVTISPNIDGDWHWLGTSSVAFVPKKGLKPATTYTVSVPKGISSIFGDKTTEDFSWKFTTVRPKIENISPNNN